MSLGEIKPINKLKYGQLKSEELCMDKVKVGLKIRTKRKIKSWSVKELAKISGISASTIKRIESGKENITLDTLDLIVKAFSTSVQELLSDTEEVMENKLEKRLKALNNLPVEKKEIALELIDSLILKSQNDELRA